MSEPSCAFGQSALRVLLLEDSRFDAELLREALLSAYPNAAMEVVRDEEGFAGQVAAGPWDVILSDYELPGFTGAQALELARAHAPSTPFIFVSGVIGEDNAVEMLKRGATDYVSKGRLSRLPVVMERALREVAERSARERAERELREAGEVYVRVVDSLHDYAVILLDEQGQIRAWNRAASDIFGFRADEVMGRSADLLFTPEDRAKAVFGNELRTALASGRANDNRWLMRHDGSRLWAEGVVTPLYGENGAHTGFSKIVRDATAAHQYAEALRSAKEEAERANHAKDRFLAVLSHELRTPLAPISSAAHVLEQCAQVPEKYSGLLPMIQRNVALEARLIDDLLDLTAISSGKLALKKAPVDMHKLARAVAEMVGGQAAERGLQIELDLQAERSVVEADEARMQQVLWNILRNATKFTPQGGRITLRSRNQGGRLVLECTDTGIGIEAASLPRIFTAFEQADREVAQRYGGLGLGLAIARGLVAQHQGELTASSPGRGLGATFTLQLQTQAEEGRDGDPAAQPGQGQDSGAHRVLLVEDNVDAAEAMVMVLEAYGYRVQHVGSCAAALQAAEAAEFDVVLTDLGLPDGSGIDVGRALSGRLPVVALSGYGTAEDMRRSAGAGFAGHLVKPTEPSAVHAMLQKVMAQRQSQAQPA